MAVRPVHQMLAFAYSAELPLTLLTIVCFHCAVVFWSRELRLDRCLRTRCLDFAAYGTASIARLRKIRYRWSAIALLFGALLGTIKLSLFSFLGVMTVDTAVSIFLLPTLLLISACSTFQKISWIPKRVFRMFHPMVFSVGFGANLLLVA